MITSERLEAAVLLANLHDNAERLALVSIEAFVLGIGEDAFVASARKLYQGARRTIEILGSSPACPGTTAAEPVTDDK